jgi:alpha-galactosidase/6-phospho-beta-glucosidase family protein
MAVTATCRLGRGQFLPSPVRTGCGACRTLPDGISALVNAQGGQHLVVEAAVRRSRKLALQAILADPVVHSYEAAQGTLDELFRAQAEHLPTFGD